MKHSQNEQIEFLLSLMGSQSEAQLRMTAALERIAVALEAAARVPASTGGGL